jgi:ParB family chromosome partitioning protein
MTAKTEVIFESGTEIDVPLSRLKKSPKNARKVAHTEAAIEALAASIGAKRMLHPLIVEPEVAEGGEPTGSYLVTIGEGRRLAQRLRAKRGEIRKTEPIRCVVETLLDAHEISLDENVTREGMHPADEFEAFRDQAERRGFGPEEIAARFGVSAQVVRQRLRLGAVSPKLMAIYREGGLVLDQLMAFAVSEDHERQSEVYERLGPYNRTASVIRRAMTESKVSATDRRAMFIGTEAYAEAGGPILRDLFTEDRGGWLEDVPLLDRLTQEKLERFAEDVRAKEGWKWAEAYIDYPHGHACSRVYPSHVERSAEDTQAMEALAQEYDTLVASCGEGDEFPAEVEARLAEIDAELEAYGEDFAYRPDEIARAGVFAVLNSDGTARIERGNVRPEDVPAPEPQEEPEPGARADGEGAAPGEAGEEFDPNAGEPEEDEGLAPLSDRLVADLTAHRTMALRNALAEAPDAAMLVVVHAAVLRTFYATASATCADIRYLCADLGREAEGIADGEASRRIAERHESWARQMPQDEAEVWGFVLSLDSDSRASILAHCVGLTVNAVHGWERRPSAWEHAEALATHVGLDMTAYWTPTARSYFGRVTKARIGEAVTEAVSEESAERLAGLKKPEMALAAEQAVAGSGWLPLLLRTQPAAEPEQVETEALAHAAE